MGKYDNNIQELLDNLTNEELAQLGDRCSSIICERNRQEQNKLWYNIVSAVEQYVNKYGGIYVTFDQWDRIFNETNMNKVGVISVD